MAKHQLKRNDVPNKTTEQLLNEGWVFTESKYEHLIRGALHMIRSELDRKYWNKNQKEMESPFENTGAPDFVTDYLTIRSYNWDGNDLPNLDTDQLKVFWYKHSNRGVVAMVKEREETGDIVANVLNRAIESIDQSFKTKKGDSL